MFIIALDIYAHARAEAAGVSIGDTVLYEGKRFRVTNIDHSDTVKPVLFGVRLRKDGSDGTLELVLRSTWELVSDGP